LNGKTNYFSSTTYLTIGRDVLIYDDYMSARKLESGISFKQQITVEARQARLELSADTVSIHKSGIEFRSPTPFHEWAEMTVSLQSPHDGTKIHCAGVVIACSGNKHTGYNVSMVFTGVTRQAQERLNVMAGSELGMG
jgi:hypothetical protein